MSAPLVSVLVRSVCRDTLSTTLESLIAQKYTAIEVLVVSAVTNHAPLPQGLDDPRIRLVQTDTPLHRSVAANKALDLAQGRYALILDDDDWIAPEHIGTLVDALEQNPEHAVAYSQAQTVNAEGTAEGMAVLGLPYDPMRLLAGNWMPPHSVLFATRLRELGCRFDEQLDLYEDWDFWLQAATHSDFLFVPVTTAFYRIHDSSGVHNHAPFHGEASRIIYDKWRSRWTTGQMAQLMERDWRYNDQLQQLADASAQLQALQAESSAKLHEAALRQNDTQQQLDETLRQLADTSAAKAQLEGTLGTLYNSRSWRLTAPVRWVANRLRQGRHAARQILHTFRHRTPQLRQLPKLLRQHGLKGLWQKWHQKLDEGDLYQNWIAGNEAPATEYPQLARQAAGWAVRPLVSVLMPTYNSPLVFLKEAIESVQAQVYPHWELCIADDASPRAEVREFLRQAAKNDPRIVLTERTDNGHISASSNTALASAKGEWVALLDHDDRLHPLALLRVVEALQGRPDANLVYSDEDKITEDGVRYEPYFKGEYNRELMWAHNMISHLGCYRRQLLQDIGGFRTGFEGSQDYDLALRVIEHSRPDQIVHVAAVLYHWRAIAGSTALASDQKPYAELASRKALQEHLDRMGIAASVEAAPEIPSMNRVRLQLPTPLPLVSILIPTRDRIELLKTCIDSLRGLSTYPNTEIIVIDNGSCEPESLKYFDELRQQGVQVLRDDSPFNYAALNNRAAHLAKGEFICLMNNDIEIITPDWLQEMLSFAALPGMGAVGTRLWYPDNQGLQHGGVIIGLCGVAGHAHSRLPRGQVGYFGRVALHHRLLAVTAACLLIRKSHFMAVNGLDEQLAVAFNDVDLCLRLHKAGYACVYTPYAEMVHHESASRGDDLTGARRERFVSEVKFMQDRWQDQLLADPFYSPNLSMWHGDFRPKS